MELTDVFALLGQQKQQQQQDATGDYWRLLAKLDAVNPSAADQKRLTAFLTTLDISPAQAKADHQLVQQAKADLRYVREHADAQADVDKAVQAKAAVFAERQRLHLEMNTKIMAATEAEDGAIGVRDRWQELRHKLAVLEADFPTVFAAVTAD